MGRLLTPCGELSRIAFGSRYGPVWLPLPSLARSSSTGFWMRYPLGSQPENLPLNSSWRIPHALGHWLKSDTSSKTGGLGIGAAQSGLRLRSSMIRNIFPKALSFRPRTESKSKGRPDRPGRGERRLGVRLRPFEPNGPTRVHPHAAPSPKRRRTAGQVNP